MNRLLVPESMISFLNNAEPSVTHFTIQCTSSTFHQARKEEGSRAQFKAQKEDALC